MHVAETCNWHVFDNILSSNHWIKAIFLWKALFAAMQVAGPFQCVHIRLALLLDVETEIPAWYRAVVSTRWVAVGVVVGAEEDFNVWRAPCFYQREKAL